MANIPGLEGVGPVLTGIWGEMMYWSGVGLFFLIMVIAIIGYVVLSNYKIKVIEFPMYGSGKDGVFSLDKMKTNRFKWNKTKTAWIPLKPFGNKIEVQPFDSEYIYPGNRVYAFTMNGQYAPGRINVGMDEQAVRGEINIVPYAVRDWQTQQHKKIADETMIHNWWTDNKAAFVFIIAGLIIIAGFVGSVWIAWHYNSQYLATANNLIGAMNNINTIPASAGQPPM